MSRDISVNDVPRHHSSLSERFHAEVTRQVGSVVGSDDGAALDVAVVQQVVGVRRIVEWEVFDEHLDLAGLGEADHLDQFGDGAPEWRRDGAFLRWAV